MDLLKLLVLILCASCAKLSYVMKQTSGQLSLEWNAIDNRKILASDKISEKNKQKIRKIEEYKAFFYKFFNQPPTSIYSETTLLKDKAVTYLVVASPFNRVRAIKHSFPFVGAFPYMGFFNKEDAISFYEKKKSEGYYVFMREVYAYSTLNKLPFTDNILSSFFYYDDVQLAELIFHELTHTIFFLKNNVSFNEAFADYIARELTYLYFKTSDQEKAEKLARRIKQQKLRALLTQLVQEYDQTLVELKPKSKQQADSALKEFKQLRFIPKLKQACLDLEIEKCWITKASWNNARFAAYMTYSSKQELMRKVHEKLNIPLTKFMDHIIELKKDKGEGLVTYLKKFILQE